MTYNVFSGTLNPTQSLIGLLDVIVSDTLGVPLLYGGCVSVCVVHCCMVVVCLCVVQCCVVVGGMSVEKQTRLLRRCPDIVIATPGRLWQLIQQVNKYPHSTQPPSLGEK